MGDKKSNFSPWCHPNQLLTSFISWTTIWAYLVCLILVSGPVSSHKAVNSGGWGGGWGKPFFPFHMRPSGQSRPWPLHRACSNNINGDAG